MNSNNINCYVEVIIVDVSKGVFLFCSGVDWLNEGVSYIVNLEFGGVYSLTRGSHLPI